jgi:hypothetical protein
MACPAEIPVTVPLLEIVAIVGFKEIQFPPEAGKNEVVLPIQILFGPFNTISGFDCTLMMLVKTDSQPVANSMYLKLALP